ncbi:hypothetical protein PPL_09322 [Heterostelium album PN500]|uniref:Uncharacterized protein n=1 Tax=Heterostelium pallidum (strain ATCC 26659 / Pp 5 / PN500) TaxID=670386 RepID=D3BL90_HETP5|nr:hypothetical protein PPL_09322 [Heterostelium album PN500]EFA77824.1 hypothetical protein PPL_09322 [Heterostelium album PN500]|eukprot:XP_020429952.1 hypothetical protein PPL_09322 [Heterostelium album PN500]
MVFLKRSHIYKRRAENLAQKKIEYELRLKKFIAITGRTAQIEKLMDFALKKYNNAYQENQRLKEFLTMLKENNQNNPDSIQEIQQFLNLNNNYNNFNYTQDN